MTDSEPKVIDPYMQKMLFGMKEVKEDEEILNVPPMDDEEDDSEQETESENDSEDEEEDKTIIVPTGSHGPSSLLLRCVASVASEETYSVPKVEDSISRILMRMEMMNSEIFRKLDMISNRIEHIEERLTHIEECQKFSYAEFSGEIIKIKEIKLESYPISDQDVMKALVYHDYRSFIYIFKLYYRSIQGGKIFYPIRMKNRRTFEYYYGGRWILDPNGHQTIKILCTNIQNLFLKHNIVENKFIEGDQWYLNQQFIMKLSEERYKKEIWKHVVDEIMIASA